MKNTLLITLLMVAGCSQAPRRSTAPPLPPLPPIPRAQSAPQGAATPKALSIPVIQWTNPGPATVFWSSNLVNWTAVTNTSAQSYQVTQPAAAFYKIGTQLHPVTLAWNPVFEASHYALYWGTASRSYSHSLDVGSATTGTIQGLIGGTLYFIAVTSYSGVLESDFSNEIQYTPPLSLIPFPVLISQ